jgi:hypothetical protein
MMNSDQNLKNKFFILFIISYYKYIGNIPKMSYSLAKNLKVNRVYDPRVRLNTERVFTIEKGAGSTVYKREITQSYSDSAINFTINVPSNTTIVDRHMKLRIPIQFTFATSGAQASAILQLDQGMNAPRAYPLSSVMNTISMTLNNGTFTYPINQTIQGLLRYHTKQEDNFKWYSASPSMPDQSQLYSDLTGSSRNPLNGYGDSEAYLDARGAFPMTVVSNTTSAAVVRCDFCEDIYLSPLLFGDDEGCGFIGIQNLEFSIQLGDLTRAWSHNSDGYTFSAFTATIYDSPSLEVCYMTPPLDMQIPKSVPYSWANVLNFQTAVGSQTSLATFTTTNNNIQLKSIPKLIYLFAQRRSQDQTYLTTDTFANLSNVSIDFDNKSGLLGSASEVELYQIALKNGVNISWPQWHGSGDQSAPIGIGSVLCLKPEEDLSLSPLQAPSIAGKTYNFQVTATFKNLSSAAVNYTFFIVCVFDGMIVVDNQTVFQQSEVLSENDILNAHISGVLNRAHFKSSIYGGKFTWDDFKKGVSDVYKGAKSVLQDVAPYAKDIASLAPLIGLGSGGKMIPRSNLRKKLPSNF